MDLQTRWVGQGRAGQGRMNQESALTCTPPRVRQTDSCREAADWHGEPGSVLCDDLEGWGEGWEGGPRERRCMYIYS